MTQSSHPHERADGALGVAEEKSATHSRETAAVANDTGGADVAGPGQAGREGLPEGMTESEAEEAAFRLGLRVDIERERALLYRVLLVIAVLAGLVLVRGWLLRSVGT